MGGTSAWRRLTATVREMESARLRRIVIGLYLFAAAADATGKALAADPRINDAIARIVHGRARAEVREARRPSGNFEIFRASSRHLVAGDDLYAKYPTEQDRFKYSPSFAVLFAPLAWIPWPIALFLWSALNALLLFVALERLLPPRTALLAAGCLLLELVRAMQNAQSNALVAALIILAFVALEAGRLWRAALAVALGASIKIFPLAALTFAIPRRRALRTGAAAAVVGLGVALLPLLITSPARLWTQYQSWRNIEASDAQQRWFSVMELLHQWTGASIPNWPVQLAGVLLLLLPLALRRDAWDAPPFRLRYLCSVLLFVVLFNHQAERASYVIAFTGATIWFAAFARTASRSALYALATPDDPGDVDPRAGRLAPRPDRGPLPAGAADAADLARGAGGVVEGSGESERLSALVARRSPCPTSASTLCRDHRLEIDLHVAAQGLRYGAAFRGGGGDRLEGRIVDAGHHRPDGELHVRDLESLADLVDRARRTGLHRRGGKAGLLEAKAQRHAEAGCLGRREELLGIGADRVTEAGVERVGAAQSRLALEASAAGRQATFPDCGRISRRHVCLRIGGMLVVHGARARHA